MPIKIDRFFATTIIFLIGWNWALPLAHPSVPIWFTSFEVIHGVYFHELLLVFYLCVLIERRNKLPIRNHGVGNKIARIIIFLGFLGISSNAANLAPLKEMGEAGRFFLLAILFLMTIYWGKRHSPKFVLMSLLTGIACGGVINLHYSFAIRFNWVEDLPFLLGQKGPGGSLGLMVSFTAWLMIEEKRVFNILILLIFAGIGVFSVSISYSKLAMLVGGFGLVAWGAVLFGNFFKPRSRKPTIIMLVIFFGLTCYFNKSVSKYIQGVNAFIDYKFVNLSKHAVLGRAEYFPATMEIMLHNPLFGVGYGGFYDAVIKTEAYKNKWRVKENPIAGKIGKSNPHNAFLYYASANGILGFFVTITLFISICIVFWRHFSVRGFTGKTVGVCLICAYFIYGMTVFTLFNTATLYIPAAVAITYTWQHHQLPNQVNEITRHKCHLDNFENKHYYEINR